MGKQLKNQEKQTVDILQQASRTLQDNQQKKKRLPLTGVFNVALVSVIVLFVAITVLAYWRLLDFKEILEDITEKSVPSIVLSGQIHNQVNTLTYLTEGLTKTQNLPSSRIATQNIKRQLAELNTLAGSESADPYLQTQLEALSLELDELASLVEQRLKNQILFNEKLEALYTLYDDVAGLSELNQTNTTSGFQNEWSLTLAEIITLAGKAASQDRLHELRLLSKNINTRLEQFSLQIEALPDKQKTPIAHLPETLNTQLLSDSGLVPLRIEQLRITGRSIGRGNFVRNLVLDYARMAEFQSYQLNEEVISETQKASTQVNQQIRFIGFTTSLAIVFLISIVYFLQHKVVSRLKALNEQVKKQLQGKPSDISVSGNDEISDIAQTFNIFANAVAEQNQILHTLSLSDGLTGIANRRAFDERLVQEIHLAKRHSWPISVLLIDVDYFKLFNDHYGHAEGDACLRSIASALKEHMHRNTDFVARYGGEEFVCILPDTYESGAANMANTLLDAIRELGIAHQLSEVSDVITASIGIRTFHFSPASSIGQGVLLEQADQALYKAKKSGRNRYLLYNP